jgi:DNA invertase Pin-like site-specific DNA recombinase
LIAALEEFKNLGIDFISYSENIDTSSPLGKAIFVIVSAMGELERNIIVERVKSGLRAAKHRGKTLGRPEVAFDESGALKLQKSGMSLREISKLLGVSKSKLSRTLSQKPLKNAA